VMDVGAGAEATIRRNFAYMLDAAKDTHAKIVALRPVNLNVAVHANVKTWTTNYCDGKVSYALLARSVACGRDEDAFRRRWGKYSWKETAIAGGAVREVLLSDLGAEYAENLQTVQTPLNDIVAGNFRASGNNEAYRLFCEEVYDRDARLHIAIWLRENGKRVLDALADFGITP